MKFDENQVDDELFELKHKGNNPLDIYAKQGARSSLTYFEAVVERKMEEEVVSI